MLTGLNLIIPELALIFAIIVSVLTSAFVFAGPRNVSLVTNFLYIPLAGVIALLVFLSNFSGYVFDKELLIVDTQSQYAKLIILILMILCLYISGTRLSGLDKAINPHRLEFFSILFIATLGMMIMVSANDLITFYLGLEIQSLSLYILIAYRRADALAIEASLKYLVLGAVGSGLFLYGTSLIFGSVGSVHYQEIHSYAFMSGNNIIFLIGLVLVLTAMLFKLSAVPFHMWTPDVYQGAPIFVTLFLATVPKVAAVFSAMRLIGYPFNPVFDQVQIILLVTSVLSLIVGAIMAVQQVSLTRMLAYSTITHMGYILLGFASSNELFNHAVAEYIALYALTSLGVFCFITSLRINGEPLSVINQLAGFGHRCPRKAVILTILMLSLAGIPPLAGFFIKFIILKAAIHQGLEYFAIVAVIASAVSAFYYLRVLKTMYFDSSPESLNVTCDRSLMVISSFIVAIILGYVLYPSCLADFIEYLDVRIGTPL